MCFAMTLYFILTLDGCSKSRSSRPDTMLSASPVSVTLLVSIDSAQTFTATFEDPNGGSRISEITLSIMSNDARPGGKSRWSANECLVRYDIGTNAIWMVPDLGGTWGSHPIIAGSSSTFSNSQCTVMASGSSARISGNIVTVSLEFKFTAKFAGKKQVYMAGEDVNGKWSANYQQQFGSFTVAAAQTP
jgi:hypothetical protein